MNPDCIKEVQDLDSRSASFSALTVEQLLYAAIVGSSLEEVECVLADTDWKEYCPNVQTGHVDIVEYLVSHEDDIYHEFNDFGNLKRAFKDLLGREAKPE